MYTLNYNILHYPIIHNNYFTLLKEIRWKGFNIYQIADTDTVRTATTVRAAAAINTLFSKKKL